MSGLTASDLLSHPAYPHLAWRLSPTSSGRISVATRRRGGPINIYHEIHGTGPIRMVFIMGLGAFRTAWKRQTRHFGHVKGGEYSVLVFDNRGVGLSGKPTCRYSTSEMAEDVVELLRGVGWIDKEGLPTGGKVNVIGVSMGGMIGQELALLLPEGSIDALVLCSTASRLVRTVPFWENVRQRVNMFVPRDIDAQLEEISLRLFSKGFLEMRDTEADEEYTGGPEGGNFPTNRDRYCAGEMEKRADKEGFPKMAFMLQAVAAGWHFKSKEQVVEMGRRVMGGGGKVAVCHGTGDRMITFEHFGLLRGELGEGEGRVYKVWEGNGHVLMWECEVEFNEWLEGLVKV